MNPPAAEFEEHPLPCLEAIVAGTLALMTGYSQALQADQAPQQRLLMGVKIGGSLEMLAGQACVSETFRAMLMSLNRRWVQMSACTELTRPECAAGAGARGTTTREVDTGSMICAPARLQ